MSLRLFFFCFTFSNIRTKMSPVLLGHPSSPFEDPTRKNGRPRRFRRDMSAVDRGDSTISTGLPDQLVLPTKVRSPVEGGQLGLTRSSWFTPIPPLGGWLEVRRSCAGSVRSLGGGFLWLGLFMRRQSGGSFLMWFQRSPTKAWLEREIRLNSWFSESYDEGFQSCYHDTKGSSALELTSSEGRWSDRVFLGDGDAYSKFHARIRFIA